MAGMLPTSKGGQLTGGSMLLHTRAYTIVDVTDLWTPGPTRGSNGILSETDGTVAFEHPQHEAEYSLDMAFVGDADSVGNPVAPALRMAQVEANIEEVISGLPIPSVDAVASFLVMPSGAIRYGDIIFNQLTINDHVQDLFYCTLEIIIPAGVLV